MGRGITLNSESEINLETILPFGETMRPLIASSLLTKVDLKIFLAKRGIFISNAEKETSIPILATLLLSPKEFEFLRERQRTKEENPKRSTRNIKWDSQSTLVQALENYSIDHKVVNPSNTSNYEIIGDLSFMGYDQDELFLEYKINRTDPTKDWANCTSRHDGKIRFIRNKDTGDLQISMEYTATETKKLNEKILGQIIKDLKGNNYIDNKSEMKKIVAGDFSNKTRIAFLLSLYEDDIDSLKFKQATNIEIGPDKNSKLPPEINWMENKVKYLNLKGQLQELIILRETKYHESLILESIEVEYSFNLPGSKGQCTIEYGFTNYLADLDLSAEFEAKITKLSLESQFSGASKREVTRQILNKFDEMKVKEYTKHRNIALSAVSKVKLA